MTSTVTQTVASTMSTLTSKWTNSTSTLNYYDYFNPGTPYDIAMDVLLIIALILSFYLVTSLSYHEWTLRRRENSNRSSGVPRSRKSSSKFGKGLRVLCILSAIFCLLRCANDIAYYKAQTMSDIPCTVLKNLGGKYMHVLSIFGLAYILDLCYKNSSIKLNYCCLVFIVYANNGRKMKNNNFYSVG